MEWPTSLPQLQLPELPQLSELPQPSVAQLAVLVPVALVTADAIRRYVRNRIERKGLPLPPGPRGLPLVGNTFAISNKEPWLTYTAWRAKYGDIMYAQVLDNDIIVLNSFAAAKELLEKRSQIYSDRPYLPTIQPYGHDCNLGFTQYGSAWRLRRRIVHQTFRAEAAAAFRPMQLRRARQIVLNLVEDPKEYPFYYSTFAAGVAMSAVYDYEPLPRQDPMVTVVNDFIKASLSALASEKALLLKIFPFLLHVPTWIPGLSWIRREATKAHNLSDKMIDMPYQLVQKRMAAKEEVEPDTMVFDHIHRMKNIDSSERPEYEKALKFAAATSFLGATDTTSTTLMNFTLAMVKNPRVWKRAQAELDAVIGLERLPEFEDRPSLPYIDALVREAFRWSPVAPLGVPHAANTSDVYEGYFIPKGATVSANLWAMSRDETRYPDPEAFIPERFLDSQGQLTDDDPTNFVFGFGRRICPGRYTADASVWIAAATMLATLDFNLAKDEHGNEVDFEPRFTGGISRHPVRFPCGLALRAHVTRETLQRALAK